MHNYAGSPDLLLTRRAAGGDSAAADEIVARHAARVRAVCHSILDGDSADDAVQETWVRALRNLGRHTYGELGPWLAFIARNEALRLVERDSRERATRSAMDLELVAGRNTQTPHELVLERELGRALVTALRSLDETNKQAAEADLRGDTPRQLATLAALSPGTARVRTHRARKRLAESLEQFDLAVA